MASIYDKEILAADDLEKIEKIGRAWREAPDQKTKDQLHQAAEAIRGSYGYSGGSDGSELIINSKEALGNAFATAEYIKSLESAAAQDDISYRDSIARADADGEARLREAYIKNMQDTLGIGQKLKTAGVTGGASESTVAYMNNLYNTARGDIIEDTLDNKLEIEKSAAKSKSDSALKIAQAKKDGAAERADIVLEAEKTAYERGIDERDFNYKKATDERDFNYKKSVDDRDFEFEKSTDARDFEYKKQQDANELELQKKKAALSASKSSSGSKKTDTLTVSNVLALMKSGVYDESFSDILGIPDESVKEMSKSYSDEEKRKAAWDLLKQGIFDKSFPELLGYSEKILRNYANSQLAK